MDRYSHYQQSSLSSEEVWLLHLIIHLHRAHLLLKECKDDFTVRGAMTQEYKTNRSEELKRASLGEVEFEIPVII